MNAAVEGRPAFARGSPGPRRPGGINYNHTDFGGRATFGFDAFTDGQNGKDCMGPCTGNASASSKVEVHIKHTYRGDLVVDLIAPDGSAYNLSNRSGGSADNIDQTFTVNLSSEARNGTWKLQVRDAATADVGTIDTWSLTL